MIHTTYTLRRCEGDRTAWCAETGGGLIGETDHDLGRLIQRLARRALNAGHPFPVFALDINTEGEAAAYRADLRREKESLERDEAEARRQSTMRRERIVYLTQELAK